MRIGMILDNEINDDIRVQNEINILIQSGHEIVLLCKGKYSNPKIERRNNLIIFRVFLPKKIYGAMIILSQRLPIFNYFWYYNFYKIIKKHQVDAIHAHDMYMFWPAKKISQKFKKFLVLDLHENYAEAIKTYEWTKKWYSRILYDVRKWKSIEQNILSSTDKVIVLSDKFKKDLTDKYTSLNSINIFRYSNVPDLNVFDSFNIDMSILNKGNSFVVFYFGGIARRRGVFTLMEAIKKISNRYNNVKLLLIGPVDKAERIDFYKSINNLELNDNLIYYPWKDISLLPSYISISDVCVSPLVKNDQHESGVANKIFQYMYFKRPLVVSNCKPQADIVIESKCGNVFESENTDDLVEKIIFFIEKPNLIKDFGENGHRSIVASYNTRVEGVNLVNLYRELGDKETIY